MSTVAAPAAEAEGQKITIRLDVTYDLKGDRSILTAMEAAKGLVEKGKEVGTVEGHVIVGRQKFPIK